MEKSRIRPVPAGKSVRMSYSRQKEVLEMPNLIEIQKDSYQWFLDEGLKEVFEDISPIADFAGHLSLEFVDFTLCKDDIKYTIEECKERDATYAAPLKVKVRLCNKDKDEINEHEIFMGDLPLMTDTGSFVINGAERVIVSHTAGAAADQDLLILGGQALDEVFPLLFKLGSCIDSFYLTHASRPSFLRISRIISLAFSGVMAGYT